MSKLILDSYDDNGLFIKILLKDSDSPMASLIKEAACASAPECTLNEEDHALVCDKDDYFGAKYKYACYDLATTIVSSAYFSKYGQSLPKEDYKNVKEKLSATLTSYGVTPAKFIEKTASIVDSILEESAKAGDEALAKLFHVDAIGEHEVINLMDKSTVRGKRKILVKLKEAGIKSKTADEHAYLMEPKLNKNFEANIKMRKILAQDAEASKMLDELFNKTKEASVELDVVCLDLEMIDKKFNLNKLYDKFISEPEKAVFANLEKTASADYKLDIDDIDIYASQVQTYASGDMAEFKEKFDDSLVEQFKKDPISVLESMPVTHKTAMCSIILGK